MADTIFRKDGTAQGVAKQRWIESIAKPERRVIYDPYSEYFTMGSGFIKFMGFGFNHWLTQKLAPGFHEHLMSRTRFIDDLIEGLVKNGEDQQLVILGAGYDSRAHRLNIPPSLKIFEVDQPEVQAQKRAKLPDGIPNAENVTYMGIDFNRETLKDRLLSVGFDISKPSIFTLEGVSQYITKEAVKSTLKEISELTQNTQSTFYMSYVHEDLVKNPDACFGKGYPNGPKKGKTIMGLAEKVGEPWVSFYSHSELSELFSGLGWEISADKTLSDLNTPYFKPLGRELPEKFIFNLEHNLVAKRG